MGFTKRCEMPAEVLKDLSQLMKAVVAELRGGAWDVLGNLVAEDGIEPSTLGL